MGANNKDNKRMINTLIYNIPFENITYNENILRILMTEQQKI